MKAWIWAILAILNLVASCAQGYYDQRPAFQPASGFTWAQNPESEGEYENRIWREESNR